MGQLHDSALGGAGVGNYHQIGSRKVNGNHFVGNVAGMKRHPFFQVQLLNQLSIGPDIFPTLSGHHQVNPKALEDQWEALQQVAESLVFPDEAEKQKDSVAAYPQSVPGGVRVDGRCIEVVIDGVRGNRDPVRPIGADPTQQVVPVPAGMSQEVITPAQDPAGERVLQSGRLVLDDIVTDEEGR